MALTIYCSYYHVLIVFCNAKLLVLVYRYIMFMKRDVWARWCKWPLYEIRAPWNQEEQKYLEMLSSRRVYICGVQDHRRNDCLATCQERICEVKVCKFKFFYVHESGLAGACILLTRQLGGWSHCLSKLSRHWKNNLLKILKTETRISQFT